MRALLTLANINNHLDLLTSQKKPIKWNIFSLNEVIFVSNFRFIIGLLNDKINKMRIIVYL